MTKHDDNFRRFERMAKSAKKNLSEDKPGSCSRCLYYRPDFKFRFCQFTRCPYELKENVVSPQAADSRQIFRQGRRINMSATIIAVANQKGGTGKTTTCENLGIGLANKGKHVLLVDTDPQASLTIALGYPRPG